MLEALVIRVYNKQTKTFQIVANIDFNNQVVDTYGDDEPLYNIPFSDVIVTAFQFFNVIEDENNTEEKNNEPTCNL